MRLASLSFLTVPTLNYSATRFIVMECTEYTCQRFHTILVSSVIDQWTARPRVCSSVLSFSHRISLAVETLTLSQSPNPLDIRHGRDVIQNHQYEVLEFRSEQDQNAGEGPRFFWPFFDIRGDARQDY
jgi:hypothetical protein